MAHLLPLVLLFALSSLSTSEPRPDTSLSLSQPFNSGTQSFDAFGTASMHSDVIDLTPNAPAHMLAAIWAKNPNSHQYWEAEFSFRVSGAERGGNGLAFWYAARRGTRGNVFGSVDQWDGFGLFLDPNTGGKVFAQKQIELIVVNGERTFECWRCTI
jgi:hypothetical protein